jgi:hypothetical protein
MEKFDKLYNSCSVLPNPEIVKLMQAAGEFVDDPQCEIDTTLIMSKDAAAAPCSEDQLPNCAQALSSGGYTCGKNFCETCEDARKCDNTCGLPCIDSTAIAASPPPPAATVCETDTVTFCEQAVSVQLYTCEADFCLSCSQAHSCDHTCGLPCAGKMGGTGGHRRTEDDAGSRIAPALLLPLGDYNGIACPWELFVTRVAAVTAVCCPESACPDGLPQACSFDCGRGYTTFLRDCDTTVRLVAADDIKDYTEFEDTCAQQDPRTLVRAIDAARCWSCGDEKVDAEHGEECDPPNLEGTGCTEECKLVVCPALTFDVDGGTVAVTNGGTYPSNVTYTCENGNPRSDGNAERICQLTGEWSGSPPTACIPPGTLPQRTTVSYSPFTILPPHLAA